MTATERARDRAAAVAQTVASVRDIESRDGVSRASLLRIRDALIALAARTDLFPLSDFPIPEPGPSGERTNALYRLSEDPDHRFALYAQLTAHGTRTPAHDHTTWAVIVGLAGDELNRLYERSDEGGVRQTGEVRVGPGTGIAFMPDDLHAIEIPPGHTVLNFHMYGLALEQLSGRNYYRESTGEWLHFPASRGIRDLPVPA